jgi:hypothetical protein
MEPESPSPYPQMPPPAPILNQLHPVLTTPSYFRKSILILSSHLRLGLPNGLFPSGFPTNTLCTPLSSSIRVTCPRTGVCIYIYIYIYICVCVCVCVCGWVWMGGWVGGWLYIAHIHIESFLSRVVVWIMERKLKSRKPLRCRIYLFKEGCSVPHGNKHWFLIAERPTSSSVMSCKIRSGNGADLYLAISPSWWPFYHCSLLIYSYYYYSPWCAMFPTTFSVCILVRRFVAKLVDGWTPSE